jgi:hypothetical protein
MADIPKNGLVLVGALLALLGIIGFAVPVITTQETKEVARIGELKIQATQDKAFAIPPLVSGGALVLGIVLIGAGLRQK